MDKKPLMIISVMTLFICSLHAHGDWIRKPIAYKFVFENQDTIIVKDRDRNSIDSISREILKNKRKLNMAILSFRTGEELVFKYHDSKLDTIGILEDERFLNVPQDTIDLLPAIHFFSICLIWDEHHKKAFDAKNFTIQFDVGTEQSFGKYYYVHLKFSNLRFDKAIMWRHITDRKKQWKELR